MTITIHIANDFSRFPSGRFNTDGPHSAEKFRDEFLYPAIQKDKVEVVLDGALTLGASFLDEVFGGLVRNKGLSANELHRNLKITSNLRTYANLAWRFIDQADPITVNGSN